MQQGHGPVSTISNMDQISRLYAEEAQAEAVIDGQTVIIDKRNEDLIINADCKRVMRNLCLGPPHGKPQPRAADITQPSFLSADDRVLFFKTKMFYLLQERHCFLEMQIQDAKQTGQPDATKAKVDAADAYPMLLSPLCDFHIDGDLPSARAGKRRARQTTDVRMMITEETASSTKAGSKGKGKAGAGAKFKPALNQQKASLVKFIEQIGKADQSALHMLDEKVLKTMEGAGYATLFSGEKDMKRTNVVLSLFPDYSLLLFDGKDEESMLNNLGSHVRARMKVFDKLQLYYENPNREDHTAHVFTLPSNEVAGVRDELVKLKQRRLHQLDEKSIQKLYSIFRDDYGTAKTTLIADGTQPVVLSRKKLDRVKRYVDECADWKGSTLVPYVRETNFFFLMLPWLKSQETKMAASTNLEYNSE